MVALQAAQEAGNGAVGTFSYTTVANKRWAIEAGLQVCACGRVLPSPTYVRGDGHHPINCTLAGPLASLPCPATFLDMTQTVPRLAAVLAQAPYRVRRLD